MRQTNNVGCSWLTLLFYIVWVVGSVLCIIKLINCDFQAPLKAEILYTIGVLTPLGAIFGWLNFGK